MNLFPNQNHNLMEALIYCRTGCGPIPEEQETACRNYVASKGYSIAGIFFDPCSSGLNGNRKGLQNLLRLLRDHKDLKNYVVITSDSSRLARGMPMLMELDLNFKACGAVAEFVAPAPMHAEAREALS